MKKISLTLCAIIIGLFTYAQNFNKEINLNARFSENITLNPFNVKEVITGVAVSGSITFNSNTSFVRILVSDKNDNVYMLYETYPMLTSEQSFDFEYECEETSFFNDYYPEELQIQVRDAYIFIDKISLSNEKNSWATELNLTKRLEKNLQKLTAVQKFIKQKGLLWTADETELSKMSYANKAKLWGNNYSSFGYEYYAGGIYSIFAPADITRSGNAQKCHNFVDNFDWRNRHSANKPTSPYYDGDVNGSGWITPVVCQGGGCWYNNHYYCNTSQNTCAQWGGIWREAATCWAFGPVAQVEALVNLYYNQHIDVKISEQYIMCREQKDVAWHTSNSYEYFINGGVPDNNCLPYSASLENCSDSCLNPSERIWINNYSEHGSFNTNFDDLKRLLIQKGPLTASGIPYPWGNVGHAMALIGWGTIDEATSVSIGGIPKPIQNEWYGYYYWIYKNSLGPGAFVDGYEYVIATDVPGTSYAVNFPITSLNRTDANIRCVDLDGDGYYFWGLGPKPAHCPPCPNEPDGDDSNPSLGPVNLSGQCTIIDTYNANFETGWDNWVQIGTDDGDWLRHSGEVITPMYPIPGAQDGDYFIYVNSTCNGCYPYKNFIIESPPINLINKSCGAQIDFYYHMHTYLWLDGQGQPNLDYTKLELQISYNNGQTWVSNHWYVEHNQGAGWKHATVRIPEGTNKVRFVGKTGKGYMSDIALDNITIKPVTKGNNVVINTNTTWNSNSDIFGDIDITNNSTLTITNCIISLLDNCKITILPGGKLILNGGTLTNACPNTMWPGITVNNQGFVQVINGGTIENAVTGITVQTGGLLSVSNAYFTNNTIGVLLQLSDNSSFTLTNFERNSNYFGTTPFVAHIKAQSSGSVKVTGCKFSGTGGGYGIWASNTYLEVKEYCTNFHHIITCPENDRISTSFSGFSYGIQHINGGTSPTLKVRYSKFSDCKESIYIAGSNYSEIIKNKFDITRDGGRGMLVRYATGYKIEENTFDDSQHTSNKTTMGMMVQGSGSDENEVYKNYYNNLYIGQQFAEKNSSQTDTVACPNCPINKGGSNPDRDFIVRVRLVTGVQTLCNEFKDNRSTDILVYLNASIRKNQGDKLSPAGNQFWGTPLMNIDNSLSQHPITYYCRTLNNEYPNYVSTNVQRTIVTSVNTCPSKTNDIIIIIDTLIYNTKGNENLAPYLAQYNKWNLEYEYWFAQLLKFENEQGEEYERILNQVLYFSALKDNYFNSIIVAVMGDNSPSNFEGVDDEVGRGSLYETLRFLFNYRNHYADNLCIVETYLAESNFGEALATLDKIYEKFKLTEEQVNELTGLQVYVNWLQQLEKEGRNIYELSEKELDYLINYVKTNTGRGTVFANIILCELYGICLEGEGEKGRTDEGTNARRDEGTKAESESHVSCLTSNQSLLDKITLVPNPTTGELHVTRDALHVTNVEIFDIYGRKAISDMRLSDMRYPTSNIGTSNIGTSEIGKSEIKINISHLPAGIYFIKLTTNAGTQTQKIIKL